MTTKLDRVRLLWWPIITQIYSSPSSIWVHHPSQRKFHSILALQYGTIASLTLLQKRWGCDLCPSRSSRKHFFFSNFWDLSGSGVDCFHKKGLSRVLRWRTIKWFRILRQKRVSLVYFVEDRQSVSQSQDGPNEKNWLSTSLKDKPRAETHLASLSAYF